LAERSELPPDGQGHPGFQVWLPVTVVERFLGPVSPARPSMNLVDLAHEDGARIGTVGVGLLTRVGDKALCVVRWNPKLTTREGALRALHRLLGIRG
jgi:hypothetical protein